MKHAGFAAVSAALLAVAPPVFAQEMKAEVIHWWTSGGESAALKVFADQFTKAGGTWIDSAVAGGANARTAAINRTVGGNPPTAMQFNTGKQFDDLVENNLLADVEGAAVEGNWKSVIPEAILNATTRRGKMYAVPVNIHGQNWVWYNKAVLEKIGGTEPKSWDEAIILLEKAKAAGLIPLAFSGQKTWERGLFNAILLDKGGPAVWNEFFSKRSQAAARSPQFRAAAETYAKLRSYVDPGAPGRNWNDATSLVIQGKAFMQVMGDWAKGEFIAANQTAGKEYGCTLFGSRGGGYVMGGDVFAFPKPKDAAQAKAQAVLAKVLLDPETQTKFAQKKGSIPVRLDVDGSSLDVCAQRAMKVIGDKSQQVPAVELLSSPAMTGALEDVYSQFWNTPNASVDQFIEKIVGVLKQEL
jgi:glucose/mannose transport system substrate-binding protein